MKLFKDLTPPEQDLAIELERVNLIEALAKRQMFVQDELLQTRIDSLIVMAARRRTPELAPQYIYAHCKAKIDVIVGGMVQANLYSEPSEVVINNVVGTVPQLERNEK